MSSKPVEEMTASVSRGAKDVEDCALCALSWQGHGGRDARELLAL